MSEEWFRSPDWSTDAQADFEARLSRSRDWNRTQYTRIKGLALQESGQVAAARGLWLRILDGPGGNGFEQASTLEHLADSYRTDAPALAEHYYRRLLDEFSDLSGTTATAEIALAELLINKGGSNHAEATTLLNSFLERKTSQFPSVLFRWHLALIRIAEHEGDRPTVRSAARTALELASRGPVFPRHKEVGVVRADRRTLQRLKRQAR